MGLRGAILGDIAGMPYEFQTEVEDWQYEKYNLYDRERAMGIRFTDDTVMSMACARAISEGDFDFAKWYKHYGKQYPSAGYGGMFAAWIFNEDAKAYNSFGNGSAMRASACGEYASTLEEAEKLAIASAIPTHNHPEGIKGAVVLAKCVFMAKNGYSKEDILSYGINQYPIEEYKYSPAIPVSSYLKEIRFSPICQDSVPVAIRCFYETDCFEDMCRLVNSMRVDTDTICAIGGAIADSYYGKCTERDEELLKEFLEETPNGVLYKEYKGLSFSKEKVSSFCSSFSYEPPKIEEENNQCIGEKKPWKKETFLSFLYKDTVGRLFKK